MVRHTNRQRTRAQGPTSWQPSKPTGFRRLPAGHGDCSNVHIQSSGKVRSVQLPSLRRGLVRHPGRQHWRSLVAHHGCRRARHRGVIRGPNPSSGRWPRVQRGQRRRPPASHSRNGYRDAIDGHQVLSPPLTRPPINPGARRRARPTLGSRHDLLDHVRPSPSRTRWCYPRRGLPPPSSSRCSADGLVRSCAASRGRSR